MDSWSNYVNQITGQELTVNLLLELITTADSYIQNHLADYEIESFLESIYIYPLNVLDIIKEYRNDKLWAIFISKLFDLIDKLLNKYTKHMWTYTYQLIKTCQLGYSYTGLRLALRCLATITRLDGFRDHLSECCVVQKLIELAGRSGLAQINAAIIYRALGNVCEHYPELMECHAIQLWSTCLSTLEGTDTGNLLKHLLYTISSLLSKFGENIQTRELDMMYNGVKTKMYTNSNVQTECAELLASNCQLYPELVTSDVTFRQHLWTTCRVDLLTSVFDVIGRHLFRTDAGRRHLATLIRDELVPRASDNSCRVALVCVMSRLLNLQGLCLDGGIEEMFARLGRGARHDLECRLRNRLQQCDRETIYKHDKEMLEIMEKTSDLITHSISIDTQLLSIYLMSAYPYCQTVDERDRYIVRPLLVSLTRYLTLVGHLVKMTCQAESKSDIDMNTTLVYFKLWSDLLNTTMIKGQPSNPKLIFHEYLNIYEGILSATVYSVSEKLSDDKLDNFLSLTSHILSLDIVVPWLTERITDLIKITLSYCKYFGLKGSVVDLMTRLSCQCQKMLSFDEVLPKDVIDNVKDFYNMLAINKCIDEQSLCSIAKAVVFAPDFCRRTDLEAESMLITLNRKDTERTILIKSLTALHNHYKMYDKKYLEKILLIIKNISLIGKCLTKNDRVLKRKALIILGLISDEVSIKSNKRNFKNVSLIIPTLSSLKIILDPVINYCIDRDLTIVMKPISQLLSVKGNERILIDVIHKFCSSLSKSECNIEILYEIANVAFKCCDCVLLLSGLAGRLKVESSPGCRKFLASIFEMYFNINEDIALLKKILEDFISEFYIDLIEVIMPFLLRNNALFELNSVRIILMILEKRLKSALGLYKTILDGFLMKIDLFNRETLLDLIMDMLSCFSTPIYNPDNCIKNYIDYTLEFTYKVNEGLKEREKILDRFSSVRHSDSNGLYMCARFHEIFSIDLIESRLIMYGDLFMVLIGGCDFENVTDILACHSVYMFMDVYADVLLEKQYLETIKLLSHILTKHSVHILKNSYEYLSRCLNKYKLKFHNVVPSLFISEMEKFTSEFTYEMDSTYFIKNAEFLERILLILHHFPCENLLILFDKIRIDKNLKTIMLDIDLFDESLVSSMKNFISFSLYFKNDDDRITLINDSLKMNRKIFVEAFIIHLLNDHTILKNDKLKKTLPDVVVILLNNCRQCPNYSIDKIRSIIHDIWSDLEVISNVNKLTDIFKIFATIMSEVGIESNTQLSTWLFKTIAVEENLNLKMELMEILSIIIDIDENQMKSALLTYFNRLPLKISEFSENRQLTVMLHVLTETCHPLLMSMLLKHILAEDNIGWWDVHIQITIEKLAQKNCKNIISKLYQHLKSSSDFIPRHKHVILSKLFVPLLKWTTLENCYDFFVDNLESALETVKRFHKRTRDGTFICQNNLYTDYCRELSFLYVLLSKVDVNQLNVTSSPLYEKFVLNKVDRPWWLVVEVCVATCKLRKTIESPLNGDLLTRECYRKFQCDNLNCLAVAVLRRGEPKFCQKIFTDNIWSTILNQESKYRIPIRSDYTRKNHLRTPVSRDVEHQTCSLLTKPSLTFKPTEIYYSLLSDNNSMYDFCQKVNSTEAPCVFILEENSLNSHECMPIICQVVCFLSDKTQVNPFWIDSLLMYLTGDCHMNVKIFTAQLICNCFDDIVPNFCGFVTALLLLIVKRDAKLDGLDLNIIKCVTRWCERDGCTLTLEMQNACVLCLEVYLRHYPYEDRMDGGFYERHTLDVLVKLVCQMTVDMRFYSVLVPYIEGSTSKFITAAKILNALPVSKLTDIGHFTITVRNKLAMFLSTNNDKRKIAAKAYGRCLFAVGREGTAEIAMFDSMLNKLRGNMLDYINLLDCVIAECGWACGEESFRLVVDNAKKLTGRCREKCYRIMCHYFKHGNTEVIVDTMATLDVPELLCSHTYRTYGLNLSIDGHVHMNESSRRRVVNCIMDHCRDTQPETRAKFYKVIVMETNDIIRRISTSRSVILDLALKPRDDYHRRLINMLAHGLVDVVDEIRTSVLEATVEWLSKDDIGVRFTECLLLTLALPYCLNASEVCRVDSNSVCKLVANFMAVYLSQIGDKMKDIIVYESANDFSIRKQSGSPSSMILSCARKYQGTLRSQIIARNEKHYAVMDVPSGTQVDKLTLHQVLELLAKAAESDEGLSTLLLLAVTSAVLDNESFSPVSVDVTVDILSLCLNRAGVDHATYVIMRVARLVGQRCYPHDGFRAGVKQLYVQCLDTEYHQLAHLLYEDVQLYETRGVLQPYGRVCVQPPVHIQQHSAFDIHELLKWSDKLGDWSCLTSDSVCEVARQLPELWTSPDNFQSAMNLYMAEHKEAVPTWLSAVCTNDVSRLNTYLMASGNRIWDNFTRSCISESLLWSECQSAEVLVSSMPGYTTRHCPVKWAFRLMARGYRAANATAKLEEDARDIDELCRPVRDAQLEWCRAMLHNKYMSGHIVTCVNIVKSSFCQDEMLKWSLVHTLAEIHHADLQCVPSDEYIDKLVQSSTRILECVEKFGEYSCASTILEAHDAALKINSDICMKQLSMETDVDVGTTYKCIERIKNMASVTRASLSGYIMCLNYNDALHEKAMPVTDAFSSAITEILRRVLELESSDLGQLRAVTMVLYMCVRTEPNHQHLQRIVTLLVERGVKLDAEILDALPLSRDTVLRLSNVDEVDLRMSTYLSQVRVPAHSLVKYCTELLNTLQQSNNGEAEWSEIFRRIQELRISTGGSYRLIASHIDRLTAVSQYVTGESFKSRATPTLRVVISELMVERQHDVINLSDVCPFLAEFNSLSSERDRQSMARLLNVSHNEGDTLVFDKQVRVMTSARSMSCVLRVTAGDCASRKFMVKCDQNVTLDSIVMKLFHHINNVVEGNTLKIVTYMVRQLSANNGLIEFVECWKTLRSVIGSVVNVTDVHSKIRRPNDTELIRTSRSALESAFNEATSMVPAQSLRAGIEATCDSYSDMYNRKRRFMECLALVSVTNWILGVGDRHLENLLYSTSDGSLVSIDYDKVLDRTVSDDVVPELQPARLTRNVLAVNYIMMEALEAMMQRCLSCIRDSWRGLAAITALSLHRQNFTRAKLLTTRDKLNGAVDSYKATNQELIASTRLIDKHLYVERLNEVRLLPDLESYTVEEQVRSILHQSTDVRLFHITRSGWEPWV